MIFEFPQELQKGVDEDKYVPVLPDDPVRRFLNNSFPHFCQLINMFTPDILPNYMLFMNIFNKKIGGFHLFSFTEYPIHYSYEPVPPVFVYRKKKQITKSIKKYFLPDHEKFIMSLFINIPRLTSIHFTANDKFRIVNVSNMIYDRVIINKENNIVPLLVISTEEASLHFAEIVCDLLHATNIYEVSYILEREKSFIEKELSITPLRKLYDCFPPAFFDLPDYVWKFFKNIDIPVKLIL